MASAHVMKLTMLQAGQMRIHFDQELRQTHNHTNPDIDNVKTKDNYLIGADSWSEVIESMKNRTAMEDILNPPKRVNKDRVVAVMINIPCPEWVEDKKEFFNVAYDKLVRQYGPENVHGMTIHQDEVHDYIDRDGTKRTSLVHSHAMVSAYAEWTDKKTGEQRAGINGKNFITKAMLHQLNNGLNSMCLDMYGREYFTHEEAERKTVEELKERSILAKQVADEAERVRQEILPLEKKIEAYERSQDSDIKVEDITRGISQTKGAFIPGMSAAEIEDALSIAAMHEELTELSEEATDKLEEARFLNEETNELKKREELSLWKKLTAKIRAELEELSFLQKFRDYIQSHYPDIVHEFSSTEKECDSENLSQHMK